MGTNENSIKGILVMTVGITVLTVYTIVVGKVLDAMVYTLGGKETELSPPFANALQQLMTMINIFYYLPLLFSILLIVWGFKIIVFRHEYTYQEEYE